MGMLRKAGERLRAFDDAYAGKIRDMPIYQRSENPDDNPVISAINAGKQLSGLVLGGISARKMPVSNVEPGQERLAQLLSYGLPAVSTAVRYGAPAGGIALAGTGVYDIVQNNIGDEQTPGTVMP